MRRNREPNTWEQKSLARKKYSERQLEKHDRDWET